MPTPVGHSLVGYALYLSLIRDKLKKGWKTILLVIFVSNLADIDYLPGLIVGYPNRYHHGLTHSLGFTLVIGALVALFYFCGHKQIRFFRLFLIFSIVYFSHIVLDFFAIDTSFPYGEPLFWPVTKEYFISPVSLFLDVRKASTTDMFVRSLCSKHNLLAVITECIILGGVIGIIQIVNKK